MILLDLMCRDCARESPATRMTRPLAEMRCEACGGAYRVTWRRGRAPASSVFLPVQDDNGRDVATRADLVARTRNVMRGQPPTSRLVIEDDIAASRRRIEEIRHRTWADRRAAGIDEHVIREAEELGRRSRSRAPSALDLAKLQRYGTTDPEPQFAKGVGYGDYASVRGVVERDVVGDGMASGQLPRPD